MDREDPPPDPSNLDQAQLQTAGVSPSDDETSPPSARQLPDDLPKSLDDRRTVSSYAGETEMYDAWQGE